MFDEFYQALKRKADLKRTAVIDTEVDRLDIVLTWDKECTYNAADSWVHQGLKLADDDVDDYRIGPALV